MKTTTISACLLLLFAVTALPVADAHARCDDGPCYTREPEVPSGPIGTITGHDCVNGYNHGGDAPDVRKEHEASCAVDDQVRYVLGL